MSEEKLKLKRLNTYEPMDVDWLWEPYIARGMLTIVEGDPNVGKSYLTMHIAAMITIGGELPDEQKLKTESVYFLSAEDMANVTVRPRIEAMGGDSAKVWFPDEPFTFSDEYLTQLDDHLSGRKVGLIIIDTLFSFLPDGVDTSKPSAIRERLHKLGKLAEDHDCDHCWRWSRCRHSRSHGFYKSSFNRAYRRIGQSRPFHNRISRVPLDSNCCHSCTLPGLSSSVRDAISWSSHV